MPLIHKYSLLCDDVRVESNGKFIVIGVYTPNIHVPTLPFALPTLCFFTGFTSDTPGRYQMRAQLRHLETGHVLGELLGMIEQGPGIGVFALRFPNVIFNQGGRYNLVLTIEHHPDPFIVDFDVILQVPQPLLPQQRY
jgi:hypothetical protein